MAINAISIGVSFPYINTHDHVQNPDQDQDPVKENDATQNIETTSRNNEEIKKTGGKEGEFSEAEKRIISKLRATDTEVRAHEMAHVAAGGQYTRSGASFNYQRGPDGRNYAVGGEVSIDISEVPGDPEATAKKMDVVKRAALAPMDPSGQDQRVAARATMIQAEATMELVLLETKKNALKEEEGRGESNMSGFTPYSQENINNETGITIDIIS